MRGVGQAGAAQVVHVRLGPAGLAGVGHAVAQQEHAQLLLGARQRLHRVGARPAEVAHRLVGGLGHVDALQLARAVEAGDLARVDPVGLHPLAGLLRDLGGRGDQAAVAQLLQPPREREAGRPRLVGHGDLLLGDAELLAQAQKPPLGGEVRAAPRPAGLGRGPVRLGDGDGDGIFVDVEPDVEFGIHGVFCSGLWLRVRATPTLTDRSRPQKAG